MHSSNNSSPSSSLSHPSSLHSPPPPLSQCARTVLLNKIISSERDLIGVVLFGTREFKNSSQFKHVYILQELDQPDAPRIKELDGILEGVVKRSATLGRPVLRARVVANSLSICECSSKQCLWGFQSPLHIAHCNHSHDFSIGAADSQCCTSSGFT